MTISISKLKAVPTAAAYLRLRKQRGTQVAVAKLLEIDPQTISRRERGEIPITREAWLAMLALPVPGS